MENGITNVSLSFCCKEDWNSFETIDERSRFCATCQHRVVDFTNATVFDFTKEKKPGSLCGRFKRSQLNAAFLFSIAAGMSVVSCTDGDIATSPETPRVEERILPNEELAEEILTGIVILSDTTGLGE